MDAAIEIFRVSITRTRHLEGLHEALASITTPAIDISDLLRAQIVLAVSSLDFFIHELTVLGMLEIFQGLRPPTDAFRKYRVSGELLIAPQAQNPAAFIEDVRERHSYLSFQQPDRIADAIRLFHDKPLWKAVSIRMSRTENSLKTQLRLVVDRRNKIAHEADVDPSYPGERWPITATDSSSAIDFIAHLCEAIFAEVK